MILPSVFRTSAFSHSQDPDWTSDSERQSDNHRAERARARSRSSPSTLMRGSLFDSYQAQDKAEARTRDAGRTPRAQLG